MSGQCAFCLKDREFVDSHIIPKGMYAFTEEKSVLSKVKAVPSDISKYPKRTPGGIYCQFLCRQCEDRFMQIDDYAIKFLQIESKATPRKQPYVIMKNMSGKKIALFFMSVLWRAHHAGHEFFKGLA